MRNGHVYRQKKGLNKNEIKIIRYKKYIWRKKMKRLVVVLAVFMLAGSAAFAAPDVAGKLMLGVNAEAGYTLVGGTVPGNYSGDTGINYGFGLKAGYGVASWGMLWGGIGYLHNEMKLKNDWNDTTLKFKQNYIDIDAAFRFLFWKMYADAGLFYGIRSGDMKYSEWSGSGTVEKGDTKNIAGILLGIGFLIPIGDSSAVDLGLKYRVSTVNALDSGDFKLRPGMASLTAGFVKYF
jgi:hypothetical protein